MMSAYRKVVWCEGILLAQQHFQQWDQYVHHQQTLFQRHCHAFTWGVALLDIDENFLAQNQLVINRCVVLLPDYRWIDFDQRYDGGPLVLKMPENLTGKVSVYMGLSMSEQVVGISQYPEVNKERAAWEGIYQRVTDHYDVKREREILLAKQNIYLSCESPLHADITSLKLAELEFNAQQMAYRMSENYWPPLLKIMSSPSLHAWLVKMVGVLAHHIKRLSEQKDKYHHFRLQRDKTDYIFFNLIKTLTPFYSQLKVFQNGTHLSPARLYDTLGQLLGELTGYLDNPLEEPPLPAYDHQNIYTVFSIIEKRFNALMQAITPVTSFTIYLDRLDNTHFQSEKIPPDLLNEKQFCLAVYHEDMTPSLMDKIAVQVKIASPHQLPLILQTFTPGVFISHLSNPGKELATKKYYSYFSLHKDSPAWKSIQTEGMIAFFVHPDLSDCAFELISY